jgi:peptidase E
MKKIIFLSVFFLLFIIAETASTQTRELPVYKKESFDLGNKKVVFITFSPMQEWQQRFLDQASVLKALEDQGLQPATIHEVCSLIENNREIFTDKMNIVVLGGNLPCTISVEKEKIIYGLCKSKDEEFDSETCIFAGIKK